MADLSLEANSSSPSEPVQKKGRSPEFMTNLLMGSVVLLLGGIILIIANTVHKLPDAYIGIKKQSLNAYEYSELRKLLGERAEGNFLQADLTTYVEKLQKVSWVGQVDIRRDWQQGLLVNVIPRQPIAKFGSERLVDANGVVFKPADPAELEAHYWMQLQGDDKDAVVMMQQVKQVGDWFQPLGMKVEEVIVTPRMAWLFRFDNGLRVLVDNEDTSEKLYKLSVMLQNQLHPKLSKIQTVDLRYKNGMAITWRSAIIDTQDKLQNSKELKVKPKSEANQTASMTQPTSYVDTDVHTANMPNTVNSAQNMPSSSKASISNERVGHRQKADNAASNP